MRRKFLLCIVPVFLLLLSVGLVRRIYAQQEIGKRFDQIDANRDGKVTPDELQQPAIFKALDMEGNGEITIDEATRGALKGRLKNAIGGAMGRSNSDEVVPADPAKSLVAPVRQGPKLLMPGEHGIGRFIPNLEFTLLDGTQSSVHSDSKSNLTVVAMTSTSCPLSKKYLPTLVDIQRDFTQHGVRFILVNCVATDKKEEMKTDAARFASGVEYTFDNDSRLANHLGATNGTATEDSTRIGLVFAK